jgi:hypothetical protein
MRARGEAEGKQRRGNGRKSEKTREVTEQNSYHFEQYVTQVYRLERRKNRAVPGELYAGRNIIETICREAKMHILSVQRGQNFLGDLPFREETIVKEVREELRKLNAECLLYSY